MHLSWMLVLTAAAGLAPTSARAGSHTVNVALQASFDAGPFLLELLETAAVENATAYGPLLDAIATGIFSTSSSEDEDDDSTTAASDRDLYSRFTSVLREHDHLPTPEALASFDFALALRAAAPAVEAQYQYYRTAVEPGLAGASTGSGVGQDEVCPVWAHYKGRQYCSPDLAHAQQRGPGEQHQRLLPFDRILGGDADTEPLVLYADVLSPLFPPFHQEMLQRAADGEFSYRVRYRPSKQGTARPLFVSGYGVDLSLKRTDYIVIDDRSAEQSGQQNVLKQKQAGQKPELDVDEDVPADLRPLSSSELSKLGLNSAGFILNSADPFSTLLRLSQEFPRYSAAIAAHDAEPDILEALEQNRRRMLPAGYNMMWMNGEELDSRKIDAFWFLARLREERQLMAQFRTLGLTAREGVDILASPAIAQAGAAQEVMRFDYRDFEGDVIVWLNDLEKDRRYKEWPTTVRAVLQRLWPGQFPNVRRDIFNVIFPVDFTVQEDLRLVVENLQMFVKRQIPIRVGIVPLFGSPLAVDLTKIVHHLHKTYGLGTLFEFLKMLYTSPGDPRSLFSKVTKSKLPREGQSAFTYDMVLASSISDTIISNTKTYHKRLSLSDSPTIFADGAPLPREGPWIQHLVTRLMRDMRSIQQAVWVGEIDDNSYVPDFYLKGAMKGRNALIVPEDVDAVCVVDLNTVYHEKPEIVEQLLRVPAQPTFPAASVVLVTDLDSEFGVTQLRNLLEFQASHPFDLVLLHNSVPGHVSSRLALHRGGDISASDVLAILDVQGQDQFQGNEEAAAYWANMQSLIGMFGIKKGENAILYNGRVVTPLEEPLDEYNLDLLRHYEHEHRIWPIAETIKELNLTDKVREPSALARLTALVHLAGNSEMPRDIFDSGQALRVDVWKRWLGSDATMTVNKGKSTDPSIHIVAAIDPTTEEAQRWLPLLNVLSDLDSVVLTVILNPRESLSELPIKRFYRSVVAASPQFDEDGALQMPRAHFTGLPAQALLTTAMDVRPSWLVAPKESVYDLDNLLLSSVSGGVVDAVYELEHILIEGHSRDTTNDMPPRGVQLLLGTEMQARVSDTIVMANLGYFQFKARPGLWRIRLQPGASERMFRLDTLGERAGGGDEAMSNVGDDGLDVALLSFQGKTLFPRLSRRPGREEDDVLESGDGNEDSTMGYMARKLKQMGGSLLHPKFSVQASAQAQAEINIFSVASGHLYERMLNIMMVSVMRHTRHTVKFWFIEQFLSPSFKAFVPHLARAYGFDYELVTYQWPHWLRPQREKQRAIWGYKILFLDVLFPLSLDKVIFVDADQIVRTDMIDLVNLPLDGAPYAFTPMCDSRAEMEGFRFWKQGYWLDYLAGLPYHISALFVVDLARFRALAAGDRLRGQYQALSGDPGSLSNLDQDLPNHMQRVLPIKSLPQEWLWCETWCSDAELARARTIDLCNNPLTKEPKLDRARRQVPEWNVYDGEIARLAKRVRAGERVEDEGPTGKRGEKEGKDEL